MRARNFCLLFAVSGVCHSAGDVNSVAYVFVVSVGQGEHALRSYFAADFFDLFLQQLPEGDVERHSKQGQFHGWQLTGPLSTAHLGQRHRAAFRLRVSPGRRLDIALRLAPS